MAAWMKGYSQDELDDAQARYRLRFPPDLVAFLREQRLAEGYDWSRESQQIREMLAWPTQMLIWDVEHGAWWPPWGERPEDGRLREEIVRGAIAAAPRLIPLYAHRFLPELPHLAGNPVFSMHGFDTVCYGATLMEYFGNEFGRPHRHRIAGPIRNITFWSDLAEQKYPAWPGESED